MTSAERGRSVITSLSRVLEKDFTESQALALSALAMFVAKFADDINAFTDSSGTFAMLKEAVDKEQSID